jgi:hypothetical protein
MLHRSDYGEIRSRENYEKEIWNAALNEVKHSLVLQMNERFNNFNGWEIAVTEIEKSIDEIEKLKV